MALTYSLIKSLTRIGHALALLCLTVSCAPRHISPVGTPASSEERLALRELLRTRESEIVSGRILARVTQTVDAAANAPQRQTVRGALVFRKPQLFRLELLPLSAAYTLQLLVSDGEQSTLLIPQERIAIRSRTAGGGLLRSALKLPLAEADLAAYLLGRVPARFIDLLSDPSEAKVGRDQATGDWLVDLVRFKDNWRVDATTGLLRSASLVNRFSGSISVIFRADYDGSVADLSVQSLPKLPRAVVLTLPEDDTQLAFEIASSSLNGEVPDRLFVVAVPDNYSVTER